MGFLADLFMPDRIPLAPEMPPVTTAMSQNHIASIRSGHIPGIPVKKLILRPGENCLFCDYAVQITEKLCIVDRHTNRHGASFRICKGLTWHMGTHDTQQVRDKVPEYTEGKLYITDQRIVFSSDAKSFQRKISMLITFRVEDNCLILQFTDGAYRIYLPVADCAEKVIEYLV